MAVQKADATISNQESLTSADIQEIQETLNISDPTKIYTSKGDIYSLVGLNDEQRATTLQQAINSVAGAGWVYMPEGTYLGTTTSPTITISSREFCLFSNGRSDCIIENNGGGHAVLVDGTSQIVYRGSLRNFAVVTSGGDDGSGNETGDGIHLDGSGVTSYRILNVHLITTGRDGIHYTSSVSSVQADLQVTDNNVTTDIGRYSVYDDSGQTTEIVDGNDHEFYFGENSESGIIYNKTLKNNNFGELGQNYLTDLGSNNKLVTAHAYQTFRKTDTKNLIPLGGYNLNPNTCVCYHTLDNIVDGNILDNSGSNFDGSVDTGTVPLVDSDHFGSELSFDGASSISVDGSEFSGVNLGTSFMIALWVKADVISNNEAVLWKQNDFEITTSSTGVTFRVEIDNVATPSISINQGVWQQVYFYYNDGEAVCGSYSTNNETIQAKATTDFILSSSDLFFGRRFTGKFHNGSIAHFAIKKGFSRDWLIGHYNNGVKGLNNGSTSIDRFGRNQMKSPLNLMSYTTTERNALTGLQTGATIFNTTTSALETWDGSAWV